MRSGRTPGTGKLVASIALWAASCGAACPGPHPTDGTGAALPPAAARVASIHYFTGLSGAYEPCGCEPGQKGGLDRALGLLEAAGKRAAGVTLVAAGDTFAHRGERDARAKLRADLIADALRLGGVVAVAPGPGDLRLIAAGSGPTEPPPLLAANVAGLPALPGPGYRVVEVAGVKVGFLGLVGAPEAGDPLPDGVKVEDPVAAARRAVPALVESGAQVIVALLDGDRRQAYLLAGAVPGIDFVVAGRSDRAAAFAEPLEGTSARLVEGGRDGEYLGAIELHVPTPAAGAGGTAAPPPGGRLALADGDDAARAGVELAKIRAQIAEIEARLAAAGTAAAAGDLGPLLARKRDEERALAARAASTALPAGAYWRHRSEPVASDLVGLGAVRERIEKYALGLAALDYEEEKPPPAPEKGKAGYTGAERCKECHEEEYAVWKKTHHAKALDTLVEKKRDKVGECVDCHVAGFRKPGGSSLHDLRGLGGVQCENCHGPGSIHEETGGYGAGSIKKTTTAAECTSWCHHPPHDSDFDYTKLLLKEILGPGHGDALMKSLAEKK